MWHHLHLLLLRLHIKIFIRIVTEIMFGRFSNIFMLRSVFQFSCHSQKSSHVLELGVALSEFTLAVYNTCQVSDELIILLFFSYVNTFKVMLKKALKNCQSPLNGCGTFRICFSSLHYILRFPIKLLLICALEIFEYFRTRCTSSFRSWKTTFYAPHNEKNKSTETILKLIVLKHITGKYLQFLLLINY